MVLFGFNFLDALMIKKLKMKKRLPLFSMQCYQISLNVMTTRSLKSVERNLFLMVGKKVVNPWNQKGKYVTQ